MIGKVSRGSRMSGLMVYLAGPGRNNEHSEPHLVAGDGAVMAWHDDAELSRDAALSIANYLEQPAKAYDVDVAGGHVWQCSLSLRPEEGQLTDQKWGQIADEFVTKMGFVDGVKAPTRWAAARHGLSKTGNDHIHIVVNLVREDGTKASIDNDYLRVAKACRELETTQGLEPVMGRHMGRGSRGYTYGELMAAARRQAIETYNGQDHETPWAQLPPTDRERRVSAAQEHVVVPRYELRRRVRGVSATSANEAEFVRRLRGAGLLVRPRFASGRTDVVTGYSVAFRPSAGQAPVPYGGGHLARDLSLERLRDQWPDTPQSSGEAVQEWQAAWRGKPVVNPGPESMNVDPQTWQRCEQDLAAWREKLRDVPVDDRATWAAVARDSAGAFAAWSYQVEKTPGPLAATADALAKSAELRRNVERPKATGQVGAYGAAMILAAATSSGNGLMTQAIIMRQLANLAKALHDMHAAAGDARRADEIAQAVRTQLVTVADRLPDPGPVVGPGIDAELAATVRLARTASPTPPGSAIPNKLEPERGSKASGVDALQAKNRAKSKGLER